MELLEVSVENVITIGLIVIGTLMLWSIFMTMIGGGMGGGADEEEA